MVVGIAVELNFADGWLIDKEEFQVQANEGDLQKLEVRGLPFLPDK